MSELDRVIFKNSLTSPKFIDFKPIPGETKSGRYKYSKNNIDEHVNKILKRYIQSDFDMEGQ